MDILGHIQAFYGISPPAPPQTVPALLDLLSGMLPSSTQSSSFFVSKSPNASAKVALHIEGFVVYRDDFEQTAWFAVQSSGRTMYAKLAKVAWRERRRKRARVRGAI